MIPRLPILRLGERYRSVEETPLVHHATGEPVAIVSQANPGLVSRDVGRMRREAADALERVPLADLLSICRRAADLFLNAALPYGPASSTGGEAGATPEHPGGDAGPLQTFDDYVRQLSATTGMPVTYCRENARKIHRVLDDMQTVLRGLTRGVPADVLDRGWGRCDGTVLSFVREGRVFGAVLPSNSPGVHALWLPAVALKTPIALKPGREEPWTPLRVVAALIAAGAPRAAFGLYPTDHAGAAELLRTVDRAMLFGDASTTRPWSGDPRIELHGPGYSKVLLGDDAADDWERHLDVIVASIAANGGRSCLNASAVYTPRRGRELAEALAQRLARVEALSTDDPRAEVAAFANPQAAEGISAAIDAGLRAGGAVDLTERARGGPRLVRRGRVAYLLPTIVAIEGVESAAQHPLANREFLFPYAAVIECPTSAMPEAIGRSLVVSAITGDERFLAALSACPQVDRLNVGPIPTVQIAWDQPHEGNLFELLYRRRAFQRAPRVPA